MTTGTFTRDGLQRLNDTLQGYVMRREAAGFVTALHRADETIITPIGVQDLDTQAPMTVTTIFRIASMTKPVTAVAAMQLIEQGAMALDDDVARWLPELASPRVLRTIESELNDTVPANRAITVRDLMRFTFGLGVIMSGDGSLPIQVAMQDQDAAPGPIPTRLDPDSWMANLAALPLAHQPGEDWLYHTGSDVLGVLLERLTGHTLDTLYRERIFAPLGMQDTGFGVPETSLDRLATCYRVSEAGALEVFDPAQGSAWAGPAPFRAGGGGLVSTTPDYLRFARMLLNGGELDGARIISEESVREITRDQVSAAEKAAFPSYANFQGSNGWGYGVSVIHEPGPLGHAAGTYGWTGGMNTHWTNDPAHGLIGIVLFQRLMGGPHDMDTSGAFWKGAYAALAT